MYATDKPAVAVSLFFIIRPKREIVNPEYLTWFLNSPNAQAYFHERRMGASVGNITKDTLENLKVKLPSLERQRQIATLNNLLKDEKKLTNEYLEKKQLYFNNLMEKILETK